MAARFTRQRATTAQDPASKKRLAEQVFALHSKTSHLQALFTSTNCFLTRASTQSSAPEREQAWRQGRAGQTRASELKQMNLFGRFCQEAVCEADKTRADVTAPTLSTRGTRETEAASQMRLFRGERAPSCETSGNYSLSERRGFHLIWLERVAQVSTALDLAGSLILRLMK